MNTNIANLADLVRSHMCDVDMPRAEEYVSQGYSPEDAVASASSSWLVARAVMGAPIDESALVGVRGLLRMKLEKCGVVFPS